MTLAPPTDAPTAHDRSPLDAALYDNSQLRLRLGTYENCIDDAGGLDVLCRLMQTSLAIPGAVVRPVSDRSPAQLAAWMAWFNA